MIKDHIVSLHFLEISRRDKSVDREISGFLGFMKVGKDVTGKT